jgi:hypothetical protein
MVALHRIGAVGWRRLAARQPRSMTTTQPRIHETDPARLDPARHSFLSTDVWATADRDGRYLMRIYAFALGRRTPPVLSHLSAARLWGLPVLGAWPREVHVRGGRRQFEESTGELVWHHDYLPDADIAEVGGLLATSRLRTMVDLARTQSFRSAVVSLDAGLQARFVSPGGVVLPPIAKEYLVERVRSLNGDAGVLRARAAAAFADERSGSSGQSLSRATMHLAGLPAPALQTEAPYGSGIDRVQFRWDPRFHVKRRPLLGEFDAGLERAQDRARHARLAAAGRVLVRWRWADALQPTRLCAILAAAGLRGGR